VTKSPSFRGLQPSNLRSSVLARSSSKKSGTRCELLLRRALRVHKLAYRLKYKSLSGNPDLVFPSAKVVIFCDGDFWHGRDLPKRISSLKRGHNAVYWTQKINANVARDRRQTRELTKSGWTVLRFWETDIYRSADRIASEIAAVVSDKLRATSRLPKV
jgi:DNA mismatch endonuclease (patch repair protein)